MSEELTERVRRVEQEGVALRGLVEALVGRLADMEARLGSLAEVESLMGRLAEAEARLGPSSRGRLTVIPEAWRGRLD